MTDEERKVDVSRRGKSIIVDSKLKPTDKTISPTSVERVVAPSPIEDKIEQAKLSLSFLQKPSSADFKRIAQACGLSESTVKSLFDMRQISGD